MHHFIEFVINHWMLWSVLGLVTIAIAYLELSSLAGGVPQMTPQEVTSLINKNNAVVVDLRTEEEFKQGHITGAIHCPSDAIQANSKKLEKYKNKPLVLICQNGSCSSQIAHDLLGGSYSQVVTLKGGINSWSAASMPLIKSNQSK